HRHSVGNELLVDGRASTSGLTHRVTPLASGESVQPSVSTNARSRISKPRTPSALTTSVHLRPATISDSMTLRGPQMWGLDPDFCPCRALRSRNFLGGFVPPPLRGSGAIFLTPRWAFSAPPVYDSALSSGAVGGHDAGTCVRKSGIAASRSCEPPAESDVTCYFS